MSDDSSDKPELGRRATIDQLNNSNNTGLRSEYRQLLYDRRRAVTAFGKFVPTEFLNLAGISSILDASLGAKSERNISTIFCDLHNFTAISEQLTSDEVFRLINEFLRHVEPVVHVHHGVIDKVIGDSVMALFPRSADDAVVAALNMHAALNELNETRALLNQPALSMCIGINTGIATLGIIGSLERYEPTAVGDAINVAARIETAAKTLGLKIVISDSVLASLDDPNAYSIRFVDRMRLKGRKQLVSLYEVFDCDPPPLAKTKLRDIEVFERAVGLYHMKKAPEAHPLILECLSNSSQDQAALYYLTRCQLYEENGAYDGTDELTTSRIWDASFDTSVAAIDEEHHMLFENIKK